MCENKNMILKKIIEELCIQKNLLCIATPSSDYGWDSEVLFYQWLPFNNKAKTGSNPRMNTTRTTASTPTSKPTQCSMQQ